MLLNIQTILQSSSLITQYHKGTTIKLTKLFAVFIILSSTTIFIKPSQDKRQRWLQTIPADLAAVIKILDNPDSTRNEFENALSRLEDVNTTVIPYQDIGGQAINRNRYDLFLTWLIHGGYPNPNTETFSSLLSLGPQRINLELQKALCLIYISNPQCSYRCAKFKAKDSKESPYEHPMQTLQRSKYITDEQRNILIAILFRSQEENPNRLLTPNKPDEYDWLGDPINNANPQQFELLRERAQECLGKFF